MAVLIKGAKSEMLLAPFCMQKVDEMVVMSIYMSWLTCNVIKIGE